MTIQTPAAITWPPTYKIRKHRKAKRVKLRASKPHGLEVTVPYRFNLRELPSILEENKSWITQQLLRLQSMPVPALPDSIEMLATNATWTVNYMLCNTKLELLERPNHEIVLLGRSLDETACKKKLIAWVKQQSSQYLLPALKLLSEQIQMNYQHATIRDQKTLWGSCTSKKSISLNYKLIFLPPYLMRHVLIHELCHTKYLNHSEKFWNLVAKYDASWEDNRLELRHADKFIPGWVI